MQKCVVVLGMHRSGTSALAGVLRLLGVDLGMRLLERQDDNPKGHFENASICQLNENILKHLNSSWDDNFLLEDGWWERADMASFKQEARKILRDEFRQDVICIKDPRLSVLLPFWDLIFRELNIAPYYMICLRNPIEVAASLKKRDEFCYEKSLLLWMKHVLLAELYSRNSPRVLVLFNDLLQDTRNVVLDISQLLNMRFTHDYESSKDDINDFLDFNLKHHTMDEEKESEWKMVVDLYILLRSSINKGNLNHSALSQVDEIRKQFIKMHSFFYNPDMIRQIYGSRGWKLLRAYYRLRDRILPPNTRRRRVVEYFNIVSKSKK